MSNAPSHRLDHDKIRALALHKGITGVQIAEQLGVSPQAASSWLRGTRQPKLHRLVPLAELLGKSVDELFVEGAAR